MYIAPVHEIYFGISQKFSTSNIWHYMDNVQWGGKLLLHSSKNIREGSDDLTLGRRSSELELDPCYSAGENRTVLSARRAHACHSQMPCGQHL